MSSMGTVGRVSRQEQFLETMNATIPWASLVALIEPRYYKDRPGKRGPVGRAEAERPQFLARSL